jgi:hypothetical protein
VSNAFFILTRPRILKPSQSVLGLRERSDQTANAGAMIDVGEEEKDAACQMTWIFNR